MLYYENTMNNTKNIILIASIIAVLGFGSVALQTNTITVDALMDNTSEILDIGEKSEITTMGKPEGKGKKESFAAEGISDDTLTTIKCSASNILKCTIKNSGNGLAKVSLDVAEGNCAIKDPKDGASRASINNRKSEPRCDYTPLLEYKLTVFLNSNPLGIYNEYSVSTDIENGVLVIMPFGSS